MTARHKRDGLVFVFTPREDSVWWIHPKIDCEASKEFYDKHTRDAQVNKIWRYRNQAVPLFLNLYEDIKKNFYKKHKLRIVTT